MLVTLPGRPGQYPSPGNPKLPGKPGQYPSQGNPILPAGTNQSTPVGPGNERIGKDRIGQPMSTPQASVDTNQIPGSSSHKIKRSVAQQSPGRGDSDPLEEEPTPPAPIRIVSTECKIFTKDEQGVLYSLRVPQDGFFDMYLQDQLPVGQFKLESGKEFDSFAGKTTKVNDSSYNPLDYYDKTKLFERHKNFNSLLVPTEEQLPESSPKSEAIVGKPAVGTENSLPLIGGIIAGVFLLLILGFFTKKIHSKFSGNSKTKKKEPKVKKEKQEKQEKPKKERTKEKKEGTMSSKSTMGRKDSNVELVSYSSNTLTLRKNKPSTLNTQSSNEEDPEVQEVNFRENVERPPCSDQDPEDCDSAVIRFEFEDQSF